MSYIVYADVESLIKRKDECKNNPEKLSTTKIGEHISSGHSMSTIWVFVGIENKLIYIIVKIAWKSFVNL